MKSIQHIEADHRIKNVKTFKNVIFVIKTYNVFSELNQRFELFILVAQFNQVKKKQPTIYHFQKTIMLDFLNPKY